MGYISVFEHTCYANEEIETTSPDIEFSYPQVQIKYANPPARERALADAQVIIDGKRIKDRLDRDRYPDDTSTRMYYIVDMEVVEVQ